MQRSREDDCPDTRFRNAQGDEPFSMSPVSPDRAEQRHDQARERQQEKAEDTDGRNNAVESSPVGRFRQQIGNSKAADIEQRDPQRRCQQSPCTLQVVHIIILSLNNCKNLSGPSSIGDAL